MRDIRQTKKFKEELGMLKIKKYWESFVPGFEPSERPDWINLQASIGIEITQAMHKREGEVLNLLSTHAGKQEDQLPPTLLNRYEGQLFYNEDEKLVGVSNTKGLCNSSVFLERLISSINCKIEKLQTYQIFDTNLLYVFYSFYFLNYEVDNFTSQIFREKEPGKRYFNIIVVDDNESLFFFNIDTRKYQKIDVLDNANLIKAVEKLI